MRLRLRRRRRERWKGRRRARRERFVRAGGDGILHARDGPKRPDEESAVLLDISTVTALAATYAQAADARDLRHGQSAAYAARAPFGRRSSTELPPALLLHLELVRLLLLRHMRKVVLFPQRLLLH